MKHEAGLNFEMISAGPFLSCCQAGFYTTFNILVQVQVQVLDPAST
jgi:hypothetical protein